METEPKKCKVTLELDAEQLELFKSILAVTKATTIQETVMLREAMEVTGPRRLLSMQKQKVIEYLEKAKDEATLINSIINVLEPAIAKMKGK